MLAKQKALPAPPSQRADIERKIMAGMITHGAASIPRVMRYVDDDEFIAHPAHPRIYRAVVALYAQRAPVDVLTISRELEKADDYSGSQDKLYLTDLSGEYYLPSQLDYYCSLMVDDIINTQAKERVKRLVGELETRKDDSITLMKDFQSDLTSLFERYNIGYTEHISKAHSTLMEKLAQLQRGIQFMRGRFYFKDIDQKTGGIDDGEMIVIAGNEKSGKTTLAIQVALANAKAGLPVQIFSLEMSREMLLLRAAIIQSKVMWTQALSNRMSGDKWSRFTKAVADIASLPIYVNDNICDVATIRAEVEAAQKAHDVKIVFVDYVQIVKPERTSREITREQEVARISAGLKTLAKDCRIPVVVLSQLNKELTSRESRAIQQDMDKMVTIKKEEKFDESKIRNDIAEVELRLMQRMGPSGGFGAIVLGYDITTGAFVNLEDRDYVPPPEQTPEMF